MTRNVLVIPDTRRGHGSGHIMRAARLVREFNRFPDSTAALVVDFPWDGVPRDGYAPPVGAESRDDAAPRDGAALRGSAKSRGGAAREPVEIEQIACDLGAEIAFWAEQWAERGRAWDAVVIDAQDMDREHVCALSLTAPVIGIDLGGGGRAHADYLIDTMLNLESQAPNRFDPGLNRLPERSRAPEDASQEASSQEASSQEPSSQEAGPGRKAETIRLLIAPGGEDPAGLTDKLLEALAPTQDQFEIDVVAGRFSTASAAANLHNCVREFVRTDNLSAQLHRYEIVITTFGLTSYEALAAGCTVIHVAPTAYHAALSGKAGIPLAGDVGCVDDQTLLRLLDDRRSLNRHQESLRPTPAESLAEAIHNLSPRTFGYERVEPGQGCEIRPEAVARFPDRTYRNGRSLIYLQRFSEDTIAYNEAYFFDEYKAQYGRSYLDDFDHITAMCRERVRRIRRANRTAADSTVNSVNGSRNSPGAAGRSNGPPELVDLGCAYGPMLVAAAEAGYEPVGVDYFEGAVEYVRNTLGYRAVRGDITDTSIADELGLVGGADVVSMWYVIEHVRDLHALFALVHRLLKPGGIFTFSTPNAGGGSAHSDLNAFLRRSPEDHWSVWDARRTPEFLRRHGFTDCHIRVTGHHPERFAPRVARTRPGMALSRAYSRLRRLGDTFEAYAVKETEP